MRNCGRFAFTLWVLFLFSVSVSIFAQGAQLVTVCP